ncbi:MAG: CpaD family pilus assembly protein [Afipia sp.]|nr:CpaD family pilus assembly protein [Afipia sp.]OJW63375.1 MAG: pilus assembly protein [Afipia sp. 64-13]
MTKRVSRLVSRLPLALVVIGAAAALGACTHRSQEAEIATGSLPADYRLRHPIVVQEASKTTEIFVGRTRGGLTAAQRADIGGLARDWLREGTGVINVDVPHQTPNARAAADSAREIRAILLGSGIPPRGVVLRDYRPTDPRLFATVRVSYPRIAADAGPCGLWPEDLGPSIKDKSYLENRPYHNFGCASQRNLAAMVDNPADLVQPRAETPPYAARRDIAFDKYRKGTPTATVYPDGDKAKLSDLGK